MTTSKLLAGASGYSFKEWKGVFYPDDAKPEQMLGYYSARLPTVEINNTFYRMPKTSVIENWAAAVPDDFRFSIKASQRITHMSRLRAETAAEPVGYLYKNLAALGGKRGPVLFQLPPNLKKDLPRLAEFLSLLPAGHNATFEFRNDTWFEDDVYAALKGAGAALCLSEREDSAPPPTRGDGIVGLRPTPPRDLFRCRFENVGTQARGDFVARNLRVLHARADRPGICQGADELRVMRAERTTTADTAQPVTIAVDDANRVSGLLQVPPDARACYVMAHGAGAGMTHPFMASFANDLAERGIATLRYQFPYMERGSKRPDTPKLAQATVRAAVAQASRLVPALALFAGGKSFGGRMTSLAQAAAPLAGVRGLVFVGFPLHPPGKPGDERGAHLFEVHIPMLFLQGTRDEFAELSLLKALVKTLGARAALTLFHDADHSFHVPARSGKKDAQIRAEMADSLTAWAASVA